MDPIRVGNAAVSWARDGDRFSVSVSRTSRTWLPITIEMYAGEHATDACGVSAWVDAIRADAARIGPWTSADARAGRWTLLAESFPSSCVWGVYWTVKDRDSVCVAHGSMPAQSVVKYHGQRPTVAALEGSRAAAVAALHQWIDAAESAIRGLA